MFESVMRSNLADLGYEITTDYIATPFRYPLWGLIFYFLSIQIFQPSLKSNHKISKKKFGKTESVMFLHNAILAIFSWLTFINTAPIIYELFTKYGWRNAICFHYESLYDTSSVFGFWSHLFYLSKFYEFIDTWIVIARGRRPITLQVYHHIGAVIGMWLCIVTKCTGSYFFIVQNSFIHTIMYSYYACSVIGIKFKFKFIITILQMIQFFQGIFAAIVQVILFGDCLRFEDKFTLWYNIIYVSILFWLFLRFYQQTYHNKKKKQVKNS